MHLFSICTSWAALPQAVCHWKLELGNVKNCPCPWKEERTKRHGQDSLAIRCLKETGVVFKTLSHFTITFYISVTDLAWRKMKAVLTQLLEKPLLGPWARCLTLSRLDQVLSFCIKDQVVNLERGTRSISPSLCTKPGHLLANQISKASKERSSEPNSL